MVVGDIYRASFWSMNTTAPVHRQLHPTGVETPPVSVGSGLLALDWLLLGKQRVRANQRYAGGSCGNVLTILSFLGWKSFPVARIGADSQAKTLLNDLKAFHVDTTFVRREAKGVTPIIVLRRSVDDKGNQKSRFEWRNPESGGWLPQYRPLPKRYAEAVSPRLPQANLFYFDRAEPSTLLLATAMREKGAIVFFEPSSCKDDALFTSCLAVSDIVKYSSDRIPNPPRNPKSKSPKIEIQTLGNQGLRYRLKLNENEPGSWHVSDAVGVADFKDATGCGDWCSAGIIHELCHQSRTAFLSLNQKAIEAGIRFGQALAAINCKYDGARGPMYSLSPQDLSNQVEDLLKLHQA